METIALSITGYTFAWMLLLADCDYPAIVD
jgi:hypothetical protein